MHHYEGEVTLRRTAVEPLSSRPQVRLASDLFDVQLDLLHQCELLPGETARVGVSFLLP
jgi:hypothetical protein